MDLLSFPLNTILIQSYHSTFISNVVCCSYDSRVLSSGVLDPLELSVISGVSCRGGLPFISEDNSVSSSLDEAGNFHKDKRNDLSSPKFGLSSSNRMTSTSLVSSTGVYLSFLRRVVDFYKPLICAQASHGVPTTAGSRSGSKYSDCPRPLPSLSYPLTRVQNDLGFLYFPFFYCQIFK